MKLCAKKNPTEIRDALSEVCGEFIVHRSTVSRWSSRFCSGCVSINNDPRPGKPRKSTDERSMNVVADAVEEDHLAVCEELSRDTGAKTSQENAIAVPELFGTCIKVVSWVE